MTCHSRGMTCHFQNQNVGLDGARCSWILQDISCVLKSNHLKPFHRTSQFLAMHTVINEVHSEKKMLMAYKYVHFIQCMYTLESFPCIKFQKSRHTRKHSVLMKGVLIETKHPAVKKASARKYPRYTNEGVTFLSKHCSCLSFHVRSNAAFYSGHVHLRS